MTPRYTKALHLAARAHEGMARKGTTVPYITHPVAVAALVAKHGGDQDQQIAALLHDVLEDGGPRYEPDVAEFGDRVLAIVRACTDGLPDADGNKAGWHTRKTAYLEHLQGAPDDTLLVSGCDKLHNASAIVEDLEEVGLSVFERFNASRKDTLWYYDSLSTTFTERDIAIAPALRRIVDRMTALAASQVSLRK